MVLVGDLVGLICRLGWDGLSRNLLFGDRLLLGSW